MTLPALDIYYWPRSIVMRAQSFVQAPRSKPYQRLAMTLVISRQAPFIVQVNAQPAVTSQAMLIGADARRQQLSIAAGEAWLFDVGIDDPAYPELGKLLQGQAAHSLEPALAQPLQDLLPAPGEPTGNAAARALFQQCLVSLLGADVPARQPEPRIQQVLKRIDALPRDEVRVSTLAEQVALSPSRLRALVQRELGCSLARYLRWVAAWKTMLAWTPGQTLTQAAHQAGFHDLAHATHTFTELFGLPPSRLTDANRVQLHRCEL